MLNFNKMKEVIFKNFNCFKFEKREYKDLSLLLEVLSQLKEDSFLVSLPREEVIPFSILQNEIENNFPDFEIRRKLNDDYNNHQEAILTKI